MTNAGEMSGVFADSGSTPVLLMIDDISGRSKARHMSFTVSCQGRFCKCCNDVLWPFIYFMPTKFVTQSVSD